MNAICFNRQSFLVQSIFSLCTMPSIKEWASIRYSVLGLGLGLALALILASWPTQAAYNPNLLTVENTTSGVSHTFTIEQLKTDFPQQTYDTHTPWMKEGQKTLFRGPRLIDVLARAGILDSRAIKVIAYDDFISEIRMDEIRTYDPILAVECKCTDGDRMDGLCKAGQELRPIGMLEKGPIFMVWPANRLPSAYTPTRNSIWVFFPVLIRPA
ncbi:hypothetical protein DUT91_24615 [Phyllobacterium salinisoli]|uniref:Oxidoreductase molybdopterin-binding domain-containing protein n=1 Tax=Phyllobacterium salinisoli TaxID=1899321 RepID=A0A368JWP8_9HYPH|nr:hypothetical protein [Phyllobacterium salinisoli]RCS21371.1 hypothetical protein DUT91_24615 [Phyllobacterium salinisoli]